MWRTAFNLITVAAIATVQSGCGLMQTVADGTTSTATAIFYKQVKTLHLDFSGRAALNTDAADMSGLSVSTLVRVYQLRDDKTLQKLTYDNLLSQGEQLIRHDLLSERAVVIKPGEGAQLTMPLDKDAAFVAVVALFRTPDIPTNSWRLVLSRNDLNLDRPRVIDLGDNRLSLRPQLKE
ncbi:type VI secretion system lipoprotein TssJ [Pseudomonas putida]